MASRSQILLTSALGALTAWSGLFALAAVTGLGARHNTLPEDPSLVPELPEVNLEQAVSKLEGQGAYAAIGDRPLFNYDRRPLPPVVSTQGPEGPATPPQTDFEGVLTGVIKSGDKQIAIIQHKSSGNSQSVVVGGGMMAELAGWTLVELQPRAAVVEGPGGRKSVELRVFDGTGGQPPTPVDVPAPAPGQAVAAQPVGADGQPAQAPVDTPEARAEMIRRRIEERRRQMREEAERARQ
jgi:general secretion pathway protein N